MSSFDMNAYLDKRHIVKRQGQPVELSLEGSRHQRDLFIEGNQELKLHPEVQSDLLKAEDSCTSTSFTATHSLCSS